MKNNKVSILLSCVAFASLTACGGGGGGGVSTTAAVSIPKIPQIPLPATKANLVTSVPTASYAPGQEEGSAFFTLNSERQRCGFGLLAQNTFLDTSARNHADWSITNKMSGHFENAGTPLYTGVAPQDRMVAAGYGAGAVIETTETISERGSLKTGVGALSVRLLLNAPYHLLGMIRGFTDVGVSVRDNSDLGLTGFSRTITNINYGTKLRQSPASGSLRTYPCEGSTEISRQLFNETPNPVPGRDLASAPLGSSVAIVIDVGHRLVISSTSMVNVLTGTSVTLRSPVGADNDPNSTPSAHYLEANEAYVTADQPLEKATLYRMTFSGSDNGVAFPSKTFTFTTGN